MGTGPEKINGILFDGAWLWEEYIDTLVNDAFYHPKNKGGTGAQKLFSRDEGQKVGLIYPDFISQNQENRIIGDAKYKPVQNIRNKDYLQILAYMFRFDAKIGCYFYPNHSTANNEVLHLNQGLTYEKNEQKRDDIKVIKLGLKIPQDVEDYQDFTEKMKQSEKQFLSQIQFLY